MSSKRFRSLPLPRFTKTDLNEILSAKTNRRSAKTGNGKQYESLEARQLLTSDIGLSFPTVNSTSGFNSTANPPNITAAVGENHIVQFVNDGYAIFNKADGTLATPQGDGPANSGSLEEFFTFASQGVGIAQDPIGLIGNTRPDATLALSQPRLVYDSGFERWYAIALSNEDFNGGILGDQASRVYLAASVTPDPTGPWKSARVQMTGLTLATFDLDRNISNVTLSVDEVSLTIAARQPHPGEVVTIEVEDAANGGTTEADVLLGFGNAANPRLAFSPAQVVASIPQVALFGGDIETNRFEIIEGIRQDPDDDFNIDPTGLDIADIPVFPDPFNFYPVDGEPDGIGAGYDLQFGFDSTVPPQQFPVTSTESMWSLAINADSDGSNNPVPDNNSEGSQIILTEFLRPGLPDGTSQNVELNLEQAESFIFDVPFFRQPDVVRQPGDIIRDRSQTLFNASVTQEGDYLYAVHSVRGGDDNLGPNSILRWYKVFIGNTEDADPDNDVPTLFDLGEIKGDDDTDFINPSIDVAENGTVAVGYTVTGLNTFPSSFVSIGVPSSGVDSPLVFNDPTELKAGESNYIDPLNPGFQNHFWGRYTTTQVDPYDPNNFWTFQQFTDADNNWAVQATQVGPSQINPVIVIEPADVDNIIEINQVDENIEVVVDTVVVGVYDSAGIGTLTVDGNGGFDQFIVNVPDLDAAEINGSYILVGDGDDTFRSNAASDTDWVFDGANGVNVNSGRILATGMVEFYAGAGNDRFEFPTSNYDFPVFAGEGNDVFVVGQDITGDLRLFGEVGDDDYRIPNSSFAGLTISDSVGSENDRLTTAGTEDQDIILVGETEVIVNGILVPFDDALNVWGLETFGVDGLGEDDTFEVSSTSTGITLFGQRGNDIFNIVETTATMGAAELSIFGGTGDNSLNVNQNDGIAAATVIVDTETITNMTSGVIRFNAIGGTFGETADSTGITLFGSDTRGDVMEVLGVAAGNDLTARGGALDDRFIFENLVDGTAELIGDAGNDRYETNATSVFGVIVTDSADAEMDVFYVAMTAGDDVIDVDENGYQFNGTAYPTADASFTGIEDFALDGLDGNDTFNINRTTTVASFLGSGDDDVFNVTDLTSTMGTSETNIDGGAGINEIHVVRDEFTGSQVVVNDASIAGMTLATINYVSTGGFTGLVSLTGTADADDFVVQTLLPLTLLQIDAGDGDDSMLVERTVRGSVDLSGGNGADTYRIEVEGDKSRPVRVIDPGTNTGDDRVEMVFTTGADIINLDGRVVGLSDDTVDVDPDVAVLALEGLGGDDQFNVIDPTNARVELFGQAGDDIYDILRLSALSSEIVVFDSVGAENDTLRVFGTINLDEFIVNESEVTINGNVLVPAGGNNIQGVEGIVFDGLGADDIFRINSTTREGFRYLGSAGDDQFFVTDATVTTGADRFLIDGGTGENEMFVSRPAILGGAAAGTEIMIEDNMIVGATAGIIDYQATDGIFSLIEVNGSTETGNDVFDDIFRVNSLSDATLLRINSLGGNDIIDVRANAQGDVEMDGGLGDDAFIVALSGMVDRVVTVSDSGVNEGNDRIDVFLSDADEVIDINGSTDSFTVGSSTVNYDPTLEALAVHALGGNDRYVVTGTTTDNLILAGGMGDDTYELSDVFGSTMVTIIDSENAENDRLTVDGTAADDTFEINEDSFLINGNVFMSPANSNIVGIESLEVDALAGDDTFIVNSATRGFKLLGGEGNDSFVINDTAADAGFDRLVIDGGSGVNSMDIQRIADVPDFLVIHETTIMNAAKAIIEYSATGGSFDAIAIQGTDAVKDAFLVFGLLAENSVQLSGAGGNDYYRVTANVQGNVWADGQAGRDRYVFFMDENKSRNLQVSDSGTDTEEIDRINVFLTDNRDEVVLTGPSVSVMDDQLSFTPTIETVEILAGGGDDDIDIQQFDGVRFLRIKGQDGDDVISSNRAREVENVILIGDDGNDTFNLVSATQTGFFNANGNAGNDVFFVGEDFYRNGDLNGAEGDDTYDVSFADRGTRNLRIIDSGADGNDQATIRATDVSSRLTLRASGINSPFQLVGTTRRLESVELIGNDERDIVTMFAAPSANTSIDTLTGADILTINSNNGAEVLNIDLGAEKDVANIFNTAPGSTTNINTGRDDDLVNIGSSMAADSGSLDVLQGMLNIDLGQGSDRIYVSDSQSFGSHGYLLTDGQLQNDNSVRTRTFAGLNYSGAEFLQLRSNNQFGQFTVTPSATTKYLLDGNLPQTNSLTITGSDDGRELFQSGDFAGIWTFDALRDIQFEQFAI